MTTQLNPKADMFHHLTINISLSQTYSQIYNRCIPQQSFHDYANFKFNTDTPEMFNTKYQFQRSQTFQFFFDLNWSQSPLKYHYFLG